MSDIKTLTLFRLHCLSRVAKLQAKLEQPDWEVDAETELVLLMQIQTTLTLMLHDLGVECFIAEDWETAERLERKS
jgi:hypothetical protein